jgi:hypothetical protein
VSLFDSAWLKWGWAVTHAQALQADIATYVGDIDPESLYTSRTEYDSKRHCVILRVDTRKLPPRRWGLRLGDVANNFRASLDHLAWGLVTRGRTPPDMLTDWQRRGIYFPICPTNDDFNESLRATKKKRSVLPGVQRADIAIVRRYQPYRRGKTRVPVHCLTPLARITGDDKHREIRTVWSAPDVGGKLEHGPPVDCTITRVPQRARREILDLDAEIHRIYVRKTGPEPDVSMAAQLVVKPIIDGPLWLDNWLQVTTAHIRSILRELAEPPEEILTLGIVPAVQAGSQA